jgi:hypothetical protein
MADITDMTVEGRVGVTRLWQRMLLRVWLGSSPVVVSIRHVCRLVDALVSD